MEAKDFAERDEKWGKRYVVTLAWQDGVDRELVVARQNELVDSIAAAGVPADELFGDPVELARADAIEYGSPDADAEAAEGLGMRDVFALSAVILLIMGIGVGGMFLFDEAGPVDIGLGPLALGVAVVACMIAGSAAVAFYTAGRVRSATRFAVGALASVAAGVVVAGVAESDSVLIEGAPRWLVAISFLLPSVLAVVAWRLVPARKPQSAWTDDEWFERFRGALRAKGVHWRNAADYESNLRAELTTTAFDDFGAPGAMARRLAGDASGASGRYWWRMPAFYLVLALFAAFMAVDAEGSARALNIALSVMLAIGVVTSSPRAWRERTRKVPG
ncbi:hypothetical protein [Tsukamurella sp. NPDC003166]|uniref:hypothetical protein n=1 Tax=Tsukamurella sp. NPDC003166 TaxID=3154444 RepID=UPI0033B207F3